MKEATRAVKVLGLKLMLLSVSLAALGQALPVGSQPADITWAGMKLVHLILGAAAAGASLFFLPQFSGKKLGATISCGILCAAAGPPAIAWAVLWWSDGKTVIPAPVENLLAIALGVMGVYIIPALQNAGEALRTDPMGFLKSILPWGGKGSEP